MEKSAEAKTAMLGDSALAAEVMRDIRALHNSPTEALFDAAVLLFLLKWRANTNAHMGPFLGYFEKEWLGSHKGWFASFIALSPVTNNGMESTNNSIKKENTLRQRLSLPRFLKVDLGCPASPFPFSPNLSSLFLSI
jgi:hypothetical protein